MGKSVNIIELTGNDGWQLAANKINENFRNLFSSMRYNGSLGDVNSENRMSEKMRDLETRIKRELEDLEHRVSEMLKDVDVAPPEGSWLYCDFDPNDQWPGTTWEKYAEGYFVMSAGATKRPGSRHGSSTKRVPLPNHSHRMWSETDAHADKGVGYVPVVFGNGYGFRIAGTAGSDQTQTAITFNQSTSSMVSKSGTEGPSLKNGSTTEISDDPTIDVTPQSIALPLWHRTK